MGLSREPVVDALSVLEANVNKAMKAERIARAEMDFVGAVADWKQAQTRTAVAQRDEEIKRQKAREAEEMLLRVKEDFK
jgi:uncharacterized Rossmann fold enzyme